MLTSEDISLIEKELSDIVFKETNEVFVPNVKDCPYYLEEIDVVSSIPDGQAYYDHIIKNVEIDRSNPNNSYIMYLAGKVDVIDTTKPCSFVEGATSLPDIDTDFPTDFRELAIEYVKDKYGIDKVCQIATYGRLSGRSAVKAALRADGSYDYTIMNTITEKIPDEAAISDQLEEMDEPSIIMWVLENKPELVSDYCYLEDGILKGELATIFEQAIKLEGTIQNQGKHAAGLIIASESISDNAPMLKARDGSMIAAMDMGDLEKLGLVKFDFLGVDILNKIAAVMGVKILDVPLDDGPTWDMIGEGRTKGCFQIESHLGRGWSKELKPRSIKDTAGLVSIIRPGCLQVVDESGRNMAKVYCDRKNGLEELSPDDPLTGTNDTYNVIIYQETLLKIARDIAGFNSADGIKLMKCISGDSMIYTSNGPKRIDAASRGDDILNIVDGRLNYSKIKKVWSTGNRKVHRLSTINGFHIDLTDNHQVMTNEGWLPVSSITDQHYVLLPKKYKHKFTASPSKEQMIIVGYFLSEGCYTEKSPDPKITNSDINVIRLIGDSVNKEFGEGQTSIDTFANGVMDIRLLGECRRYIKSRFEKNKSKDKSIPQYFLKSSMEHRRTLVSCYFDGDGTVSDKNLSISSASKEILLQIQSILVGDGIHAGLSKKYNKSRNQHYYTLSICNRPDISIFENLYSEFISTRKKKSIRDILERDIELDNCDKKARIPKNIIKACFGEEPLNKICGHRINVGQCYNNSLTLDKAKYLNKIIGSSLVDEILNSEYLYFQVSKVEELDAEVEVYDYETEDDTHCGFINGILVHNSVGKKDAKLLFSLEEKFVNGCVKTGKITKEQAIYIFGQIKKSARYLFNASHAYGYSYPAYWSAYIKCHYPLQFYKEWMQCASHKLDPHLEMKQLMMSARIDGISILPPSVKHLERDFFIRGESVHFGLSSVKAVSDKELDKLFDLIKEKGGVDACNPVVFLLDIFHNVNKRTIENLIEVGAFDYTKWSRSKLKYYFECLRDLTDKERDYLIDAYYMHVGLGLETSFDLIMTIAASARPKKEGGAAATKPRIEKIIGIVNRLQNPGRELHDIPSVIASREEQLTGTTISMGHMDDCLAAGMADATCKDFVNGKKGKYSLIVNIKQVKRHIIKSSGKEMAFLVVEDDSCEMENVVCFADKFEQYSEVLFQGNNVAIFGEVSQKGSFAIERVVSV